MKQLLQIPTWYTRKHSHNEAKINHKELNSLDAQKLEWDLHMIKVRGIY